MKVKYYWTAVNVADAVLSMNQNLSLWGRVRYIFISNLNQHILEGEYFSLTFTFVETFTNKDYRIVRAELLHYLVSSIMEAVSQCWVWNAPDLQEGERGIHPGVTQFIKAPNRWQQSHNDVGGARPSRKSGKREAKAEKWEAEEDQHSYC